MDNDRPRHAERPDPPPLAELLLAIPQDGGEFERMQLRPRPLSDLLDGPEPHERQSNRPVPFDDDDGA